MCLLLVASLIVPHAPVHRFRPNGRRFTETPLGWQDAVLLACRAGAALVATAALLSQQRTVETIDDIIREEAATIPYDRSTGVDARGNTRVQSEPAADRPRPGCATDARERRPAAAPA